MIQSKEKRIKKLKKGHIWPSVLLFVIAIIVANIVSIVMLLFIVTYFAGERVNTLYNDTVNAGQMLTEGVLTEDEERVLDYLENSASFADAVYILDENGGIVAGFGGATFNPSRNSKLELGLAAMAELTEAPDIEIHTDLKEPYGVFSEDGSINLNSAVRAYVKNCMEQIMQQEGSLLAAVMNLMNVRSKELIYAIPFWTAVSLPGQQTAMMKYSLNFYAGDFGLAIRVVFLYAVVMFLPLLFLFVNLIKNVHAQRRMTKLLYTDVVTGGKNWLWFEHSAEKILCAGKNANTTFALVDVTLMKYRSYCACHGVPAGEKLLESINWRLAYYMSAKSECCALNGKSSFGLLLKCKDRDSCEARVKSMLDGICGYLGHESLDFHAGIYFVEPVVLPGKKRASRRKNISVDELYNRASSARASLPDENLSGVAVFDQKLLEEQLWEHRVGEKMQGALEHEEFQVYIQPKYNPVNEKLAGAEALVRWINAEDGFISPGRFIPIFEKNGFITKLDDYMISHVAKLQAEWLAEGKEVVPVSVNVSRAHFADPNLAQHICELVDQYQLPHHLLEIELTESAFFDDKELLLDTVRKLKEMGFDISMDDFGAGYSSLNSLKDLPLDVLKLDAEFFRGEGGEERGEIVVSQAIDLAKKLNMRIVAEGVEKKNQVDFLAAHDCDMIQGFYFAKPMPAKEYEEKLERKGEKTDGQEQIRVDAADGVEQL